jgi:hypothetical protein
VRKREWKRADEKHTRGSGILCDYYSVVVIRSAIETTSDYVRGSVAVDGIAGDDGVVLDVGWVHVREHSVS